MCPEWTIANVARQLHAMDAELPLAERRTIGDIVRLQTGSERFTMLLLGLFAMLGLVLAAVGVYGVVSYAVAQSTRDIGIRMALGARTAGVLGAVVGQALRLALVGVGIGVAMALAVTRFLPGLLYGVTPTDPLTFVGASLILTLAVLLASAVN